MRLKNRLPYPDTKKTRPGFGEQLWLSICMKNTPLEAGIFALWSPLPLLFLAELWALILILYVCFHLLGLNSVPVWLLLISLLPMLISPLLGILGIIHGFRKRKEPRAWLGILLSFLSLVENGIGVYLLSIFSKY